MNIFRKDKTQYWQRSREMGHLSWWSNAFLEDFLSVQIQKELTTSAYLLTQVFHHAIIKKILMDVYHMPESILSIFLPGTDMEIKAQSGRVICPRLHSYSVPEPIFELKQSQVWERWCSGPSSLGRPLASGSTQHSLCILIIIMLMLIMLNLVNDYYVESSYEIHSRTPVHLSKASACALHTPVFFTVHSPWLPEQNFPFLCVPTAFGAQHSAPCIMAF